MRAVVVYESIYGNTHRVADAIADGLRSGFSVTVMPASDELRRVLDEGVDLLVIGGPTHAHGLTSDRSRLSAIASDGGPNAAGHIEGEALRRVIERVGTRDGQRAAVFDTRIDKPVIVTGSAAKGAAKRLRGRGFSLVAEPESFRVEGGKGPLLEGELARAAEWGRTLAAESAGVA